MATGISTRNQATMEKSSLFVEVESLRGAMGYPLRTPRLEDTVLDAHTREPITVITEIYLGVLHFCGWSQPGYNQKLAHLISEIRVERSHLIFCTNCHKIDITTGYRSWVEIHPFKKKQYLVEFSMLHRHLIFSFVCLLVQQTGTIIADDLYLCIELLVVSMATTYLYIAE